MEKNATKFTKEDFLTAAALVKKLNEEHGKKYNIETVKKILKTEYRKKTKIKTKFNSANLVYDAKWNHRESLRLHPLGFEQFKEILEKGAQNEI